jgi:hypothetical protein
MSRIDDWADTAMMALMQDDPFMDADKIAERAYAVAEAMGRRRKQTIEVRMLESMFRRKSSRRNAESTTWIHMSKQ